LTAVHTIHFYTQKYLTANYDKHVILQTHIHKSKENSNSEKRTDQATDGELSSVSSSREPVWNWPSRWPVTVNLKPQSAPT